METAKQRIDNDMKNPTQKSIKRLSIATLIMGGLTLAYTYWEMIAQLWVSSYIYPLTWNPDIKGWQIFILAARFVGVTSLFILCCIFLFRTNKGLKDGEIFPKSNLSLIRWAALADCPAFCFSRMARVLIRKAAANMTRKVTG